MQLTGRVQPLVKRLPRAKRHHYVFFAVMAGVFVIALLARLPYMSHGLDQWDTVLYKDSLEHMRFFREAEWPILLLFQKFLWLLFPGLSAPQILSLTNIILASATLALFFAVIYKITRSYVSTSLLTVLLFFVPLFGVYSVVGMQDIPQTFGVMLYMAAILQFCLAEKTNLRWLYIASFIAGLMMGIRFTMILVAPSLLLAMLLTRGLTFKIYVKTAAAFLGGALIWVIAELFIPAMPNAQPVGFFLSQFHQFNPTVLGYWTKAGDYTLLSGYRLFWFAWLPLFWIVIYVIARLRQKKRSPVPIIALLAALITLLVAHGLGKVIGPPHRLHDIAELSIITILIVYETVRNLPHAKEHLRTLTPRDKALKVISSIILFYVIFNYSFTGPVARYLLPIIPVIIVTAVLLVNYRGVRSWWIALVLLLFAFWGQPFGRVHSMVASYHTLDTRSSVAMFIKSHPQAIFYDIDPNHAYGSHLITYGLGDRITTFTGPGCPDVKPETTTYMVFYGPVTKTTTDSCPQYKFTEVARYQRNELIIEDSLGNIGYTIYLLSPN